MHKNKEVLIPPPPKGRGFLKTISMNICISMPFLVVNKSGALFEFEKKPEKDLGSTHKGPTWWSRKGKHNFLCMIDLEGQDWEGTLQDFSSELNG